MAGVAAGFETTGVVDTGVEGGGAGDAVEGGAAGLEDGGIVDAVAEEVGAGVVEVVLLQALNRKVQIKNTTRGISNFFI